MALKPCPSCGHDVSSDAAFCPSCGHPIKGSELARAKKSVGFGCFPIFALIFVLLFWGMYEGQKDKDAEKANPTCISDYTKCKDNDDLVENHKSKDGFAMSIVCQSEAENLAKYGSPKFSFPSFHRYFIGQLYITTGKATLIDDGAEFQNGFGAYENVTARCEYDLKTDTATLELIPR